ncbi:ABC transporter permease [Oceanobacillus jeddahense]|uniref:ABC transporter permease n=1 Tax=Oceanobacillus jeddahense TaxID=1462527 RepID=UPI000595AB46|nr:iron ABC transporter permease [Oceanobacillus jeddahense]
MGKWKLDGFTVIKWLIFLFFLIFLVVPLITIFIVSFIGEPINLLGSLTNIEVFKNTMSQLSQISLEPYLEFFQTPRYFSSLVNSLGLSLFVTLLTTLMCIPMAYAFAKTNMKFKKLFGILVTIPLIMPTFVFANGFITMFGRTGWVTNIWDSMTGNPLLFDVHSMLGIIIVQIFSFFPYAFWPMVASFKVSDMTLEEAAHNMGARTWYTFSSVTFPLAIAGIASSMLLVFTVSFSDFGTPIVLAPNNLNLIVVEAYREMSGFSNWSGSSVLTVVMIIVAGLFFWLQRWVTKKKEYGTISGKPKNQKLNENKVLNSILSGYTFLVLLFPILILASIFLASIATNWGHNILPNGYTMNNYFSVFNASKDSIFNSLFLAGGALLLSVIIATFISYYVVRRGSAGLDLMSTIPLVIPGIGLGIALIQTFNTAPLQLTGTAIILIIAYTIRRLPYMIRSTMGTMMSIRRDIEEAAENLGASKLFTLVTIIGPLLMPGIAAGAILVFVTVIKETSITILLANSQWAPMSLVVFQHIMKGEHYHASAMSILIIILVIVLQYIANKLASKDSSGA